MLHSRPEEANPNTRHAVLVEYAEEEEGEGETPQLKTLHIRGVLIPCLKIWYQTAAVMSGLSLPGWLLSEQVATLLREALVTTQLTTLK